MKSHCFNKGIIYCYNNLWKYKSELTDEYFIVHQLKRDTIFLFDPNFDFKKISQRENSLIYCEEFIEGSKPVKEMCYDLEKLFNQFCDKQIRRGMNFSKRENILITDNELKEGDRLKIYNEWKDYKYTKVFRIAFNPERYLRSYQLRDIKEVNYYERIIYVNSKPYAVINFSLDDNIAFEISFASRFFDKDLRFINDLNECILINCFYDLYINHNIKIVNVGPDAGIKGLKQFKNKLPSFHNTIYSITLKKELAKLF